MSAPGSTSTTLSAALSPEVPRSQLPPVNVCRTVGKRSSAATQSRLDARTRRPGELFTKGESHAANQQGAPERARAGRRESRRSARRAAARARGPCQDAGADTRPAPADAERYSRQRHLVGGPGSSGRPRRGGLAGRGDRGGRDVGRRTAVEAGCRAAAEARSALANRAILATSTPSGLAAASLTSRPWNRAAMPLMRCCVRARVLSGCLRAALWASLCSWLVQAVRQRAGRRAGRFLAGVCRPPGRLARGIRL